MTTPRDVQAKLTTLIAYASGDERPSRERIAAELRALADDVERGKTAAQDSLVQFVWDRKDLRRVLQALQNDEITANLLRDVYEKLWEKMALDQDTSMALGYVRYLKPSDDPDQIRNQVFKAANLLGLRLPHGIF